MEVEMTNSEIIAMLYEDLKGEHMAIVQYLLHAYAMGEMDIAFEIEAISREEMRHFDWLSELVVELGGKPTMERAPFLGVTDNWAENMRFDVQAEQGAIDLYRKHIEAIEDPKIRLVLSRILSDEESHREDFTSFAEKMAQSETAGEAGGQPPARIASILDEGIRHEYTVILQYLYHRFLMPDCEAGNELEMQSINEMQHLGWLAEKLQGMGGKPVIEHTPIKKEDDEPDEMLEADIEAERAVTAVYSSQIPEIEDPGLKGLITRIRDHEIYHEQVFSGLLTKIEGQEKKAEEEAAPAPSGTMTPPTVGSLLGQTQE
jgi:bacterioferritin